MSTKEIDPDVVVWAHNVKNGHGEPVAVARRALEQKRDLGADIVVMSEAKALVRPMRDLAGAGLKVVAETPLPRQAGQPIDERGDTVVVADKKIVRRTWFAVHDLEWWVVRYMRKHRARRDPFVMLRTPVRGVAGAHLPPGGPDSRLNGKAWRDQADHLLNWAARRGCRAIVADWNCSKEELARYLKGHRSKHVRRAQIVGVGIDLVVVVRGSAASVNLGHQGSDHPAVLYAINAKKTRIRRLREWLKQKVRRSRK